MILHYQELSSFYNENIPIVIQKTDGNILLISQNGKTLTDKYDNIEFFESDRSLATKTEEDKTISAIIADEAAIGMINNKTTAVRIIPAPGKTVGDSIEMGGLLGTAPVMPVHNEGCADFINRGGRIPAPLNSLKN